MFIPHGIRPEETMRNPWLRQQYPNSMYPVMNMGPAVLPQTTMGPFPSKEDFRGFGQGQGNSRFSLMIIIVVLSFILMILNAIQIVQLNNMSRQQCKGQATSEAGL